MNHSPSLFILINPRSGGHSNERVLSQAREWMIEKKIPGSAEFLQRDSFLEQVQRAAQHQVIIVGGGDGTVSRLLAELQGCTSRIGVLPLGTGNDLARELGVRKTFSRKHIAASIETLYRSPSRPMQLFAADYGEDLQHSISFCNYLSLGYDAKVVHDFSRIRESRIRGLFRGAWGNRGAYALASGRNLFSGLSAGVEIVRNGDAPIALKGIAGIFFANIRSVMGLGVSNPHSDPFDASIECLEVRTPLGYSHMLLGGKIPFFRPTCVGSAPRWEIRNIPSGTVVQIDGEPWGELGARVVIRAAHIVEVCVGGAGVLL